MPMRSELPSVAERPYVRAATPQTGRTRFIAAISNRDLHAIILFCTIGFLLTIDAVLRFSDFGALFAQLASFP
jgi:hypothetical protein